MTGGGVDAAPAKDGGQGWPRRQSSTGSQAMKEEGSEACEGSDEG